MEQILKLVEIAEKYAEVGELLGFKKNEHNYVRTSAEKGSDIFNSDFNEVVEGLPDIRLYFSNHYSKWCLDYGSGIAIAGYKETIELPFHITLDQLETVIFDLEQFLPKLLEKVKLVTAIKKEEVKKEIADLEAKLEKLKR